MAAADTRDRILDAAEALFARQGFSATSLRAVIAEAGVNLAAVHYHFGSRHELVRAVFSRRFEPINEERLARMAALVAPDAGVPAGRGRLEAILHAMVDPLVRAARDRPGEWSLVSQLVGRAHTDADFDVRRILNDQFRDVFQRFSEIVHECLPQVGESELVYRLHFVIAAMAVTLVHGEDVRTLSDGRIDPVADAGAFARRWVAFAAAGLAAPASETGGDGAGVPGEEAQP